ncbi:MAG: hypothetical protein KBF26_02970 [Opitutaceae bacterium]|nr:hypothetical protein [Opitutaceae bacterium]
MRSFTRYFVISVFFACVASAAPLDKPITVTTRDQVLLKLNSLREELPPQVSLDLAVAIRALERQCDDLSTGLSKEERDSLCVALIDGRTPRQIILTAASLMLAESAELNAPGAAVDGSKLSGDDFARWRHLTSSRSTGLGFVKAYATAKGDDARNVR